MRSVNHAVQATWQPARSTKLLSRPSPEGPRWVQNQPGQQLTNRFSNEKNETKTRLFSFVWPIEKKFLFTFYRLFTKRKTRSPTGQVLLFLVLPQSLGVVYMYINPTQKTSSKRPSHFAGPAQRPTVGQIAKPHAQSPARNKVSGPCPVSPNAIISFW